MMRDNETDAKIRKDEGKLLRMKIFPWNGNEDSSGNERPLMPTEIPAKSTECQDPILAFQNQLTIRRTPILRYGPI